MPQMNFHLGWPDGSTMRCYSPSLVIKDYFEPGSSLPVAELLSRSREALGIASERVREKYGFACSMALDQLAEIETQASRFPSDASVRVLHFEEST